MKTRLAISGFLFAALVSTDVNALTITKTFDIIAAGFNEVTTPITDPVHFNFTVSFNFFENGQAPTTDFVINSFNLSYSSMINYNHPTSYLTIATHPLSDGCIEPKNSYCAIIYGASENSPTLVFFSQAGSSGGAAIASHLQLSSMPGAVPEPAAWALLMVGFGAVGRAIRSRRRASLAC